MTTLHRLFFPTRLRHRLRSFVVVAALLVAAGLITGPPLGAETPEAGVQGVDASSVSGPEAVRIVYQGKLEESGGPARRAYDFVFRLFAEGDGGLQVGPSLSVDKLAMLEGSFAVNLDFGAARLAGEELWLEVAVRDHDQAAAFTALSPRQRLTGTPYAILAQGGDWSLIGVPIGGPPAPGLCQQPVEQPAGDGKDLGPIVPRSLSFSGLDHTIIASTVTGQSYSRQIRIGFSDTPTPNPATFSDIRVGIGTLAPQATLHVDQPHVPNNGEAARITFSNLNVQESATGLRIVESQSKTTRGLHQGLAAMTSVAAGGQAGQSSASLAESSGFFAQGTLLGVAGRSTPNQLDNFSAANASQGLGGRFIGQPSSPLFLSGTGRYFVGGAYGEVAGQIDGNPGGGAVAGIIGIDNSTGSADSWAGWFLGRGYFAGDVGIGTTAPTRRLDVAGEARIRVLTPGSATDDVVVADPSGVLRRASGSLFADTDWCISSTGGNVYTGLASGPPKCQAGNVGVGTATPAAKLHIVGTTLFSGTAVVDGGQMLRGSVAGGARILGDQGNTPSRPAIGFFSAVGSLDDGGGGNGIFRPLANTMAFATVSQERMRLTSGGSLGLATQTPTALLDVNGTARVRTLTGGPSQALVTAESNGTLHSIPFPGSANQVLLGNGTFGPVASVPDNDWSGAGTGNMFATFSNDNVSVGLSAGPGKLNVLNSGSQPKGGYFECNTSATLNDITCVQGFAHAPNAGINIGLWGDAAGNGQNFGVEANALKAGASQNIAVRATAGGGSVVNFGIRAEAPGGGGFNKAGWFQGDVRITGDLDVVGTITKGAGAFKIDHPLAPEDRYLVHSFVESPEMMNVYNGNVTTDGRGEAWVDLPGYFEALNRDFRYQLTVLGQFAQAIVGEKILGNRFLIRTDKPGVEVSWQVTGIRNDPYARAHRLEVEPEKTGPERGHYLHPELYGASEAKRLFHELTPLKTEEP